MSNTIPTQVPSARHELPRAKGDSATRRTAASGASGSPGVVVINGSRDAGEPNKVSGAATERAHEAIRDAVAKEIAKAAEQADRSGVRVSTEVHEATGRYIIKVIEGESGKVLREFPPAEYLDVMAALEELGGTLVEGQI